MSVDYESLAIRYAREADENARTANQWRAERDAYAAMLTQILARWDVPHSSFMEWNDLMAIHMAEARALLAQRNK